MYVDDRRWVVRIKWIEFYKLYALHPQQIAQTKDKNYLNNLNFQARKYKLKKRK